jgi:hypothetical protein
LGASCSDGCWLIEETEEGIFGLLDIFEKVLLMFRIGVVELTNVPAEGIDISFY